MVNKPQPTSLDQAKQILKEHKIEKVILFDHKPVLRIQVPNSQLKYILENRSTLVEKLKSTGFRFIAVDLNEIK